MKRFSRFGSWLLAAACIGLGVVVWFQRREIVRLNSAATAGKAGAGLPAVAARTVPPPPNHAPIAADRAETPPAPEPSVQNARKNSADALVASWMAMMNDPAFVRLNALQQKARIELRYRKLFQTLGLNEAQSGQLETLLLQRLNIVSDLAVSSQQAGSALQTDPDVFAAAVTDAKAQIDGEIAAMLGPGGYSTYQAFDKDQRSQITVNQAQGLLTSAGAPLNSDQSAALQQALTEKGVNQFGVRQVTGDVIAEAQAFLSPAQVQGLQQLMQLQQQTVQMKQLQHEYQQAAGSTIPISPKH